MAANHPAPPLLRSMIFSPGDRQDLVAKGIASGADAVIVDLEDAVPESAKEAARRSLRELPASDVPMYVRVNSARTAHLWDDLLAAGTAGVAGVVLPKADDPALLVQLDGALTVLERQVGWAEGSIEVIPLIESAKGVMCARQIFEATGRVRTTLFGSGEHGDLVADLHCEWTPDGTALLTARSMVVLAARATEVQPLDAVFMDYANLDGLRTECLLARRVGCAGKVAIHPAQVPVIHEVFTPAPDEVARQRRIVELFDQALAQGRASISVDGQMVDYAVAAHARSILARSDAVRQR